MSPSPPPDNGQSLTMIGLLTLIGTQMGRFVQSWNHNRAMRKEMAAIREVAESSQRKLFRLEKKGVLTADPTDPRSSLGPNPTTNPGFRREEDK